MFETNIFINDFSVKKIKQILNIYKGHQFQVFVIKCHFWFSFLWRSLYFSIIMNHKRRGKQVVFEIFQLCFFEHFSIIKQKGETYIFVIYSAISCQNKWTISSSLFKAKYWKIELSLNKNLIKALNKCRYWKNVIPSLLAQFPLKGLWFQLKDKKIKSHKVFKSNQI